jgi:Zn-dependent alcohol dehydrogenase
MNTMVKAGSSTVKVAIINAIGRGFDVANIEVAEPIRHEALVKVKASGLCRTDHTNTVHDMGYPMPSVFGHEITDIFEATGPEIHHLRVGDHVVACLLQSCGVCAKCLGGKPFQCAHGDATMRRVDEPPRLNAVSSAKIAGETKIIVVEINDKKPENGKNERKLVLYYPPNRSPTRKGRPHYRKRTRHWRRTC